MKLLLVFGLALASFQGSSTLDLSQYKPRLPPAYDPNYVPVKRPMPPMRAGTIDMRAVCGQPNPAASKIVGGWEAGVHEFPWQAVVLIDGGGLCGGSLIGNQWILTAAHCADGARRFEIVLGAHDRTDSSEPGRVSIPVTARGNTFIHPEWNSNLLTGDLALINLPEPVTFTDNIRPICLPEANEANQRVGEVAVVSGWGRTSDGNPFASSLLRKTNVTVITNDECNAVYGIVDADTICVSTTDGHGTCNGDSGGPLSHVDADGIFTQIGVVSYGASAGCQAGYPDAFRRVSNYRNWITSTTGLL